MQFNLEQTLNYLRIILNGKGSNIEIIPQELYEGERIIVLEEFVIDINGKDTFDLVLISDDREQIEYLETWDIYIEPKPPRSQQWKALLHHSLGTTKLMCFSSF